MIAAGMLVAGFFHHVSALATGHPDNAGVGEEIGKWINLEAIQLLAHHTSAVVAAVVLFWFVGFMVQRLMHDTMLRRCVLVVDEFVLLCLFVYFAYELFLFL